MARLGCETTYTDGCNEMLQEAVRLHPELAEHARVASFPLPEGDELLMDRFDLVLCVGVIMHLDDTHLQRFASQMALILPVGGHLILSHSTGNRSLVDNRDANGRLFQQRSVIGIDRLFEQTGFQVKRHIENPDGLRRPSIVWMTEVLRKVD